MKMLAYFHCNYGSVIVFLNWFMKWTLLLIRDSNESDDVVSIHQNGGTVAKKEVAKDHFENKISDGGVHNETYGAIFYQKPTLG